MSKIETNTIDNISGSSTLNLGDTNATAITIDSGVSTLTIPDGSATGHMYPMFFVTKTSNQTISDNVFTKITFDNSEYDTASGWSTSNNRYTPGVLGKYYIFGRMRVNASGNDRLVDFNMNIRKNGTQTGVLASYTENGTTARTTQDTKGVNGIVEVTNTSDYFEFWGASDLTAGSPIIVGDSSYHFTCFGGYRLGA